MMRLVALLIVDNPLVRVDMERRVRREVRVSLLVLSMMDMVRECEEV